MSTFERVRANRNILISLASRPLVMAICNGQNSTDDIRAAIHRTILELIKPVLDHKSKRCMEWFVFLQDEQNPSTVTLLDDIIKRAEGIKAATTPRRRVKDVVLREAATP